MNYNRWGFSIVLLVIILLEVINGLNNSSIDDDHLVGHEMSVTNLTLADEIKEMENMEDDSNLDQELCPYNNGGMMTEEARRTVLDFHNEMRSKLARGLQRDKRSEFAPKAAKLLKMVYDCDLELSAQLWSNKCTHSHTPQKERRAMDIGENLAWIPGNKTEEQFMISACNLWWTEVERVGVGKDNVFLNDFLKEGVGHYTQMAWQRTFRLGCGMTQCDSRMFIVCHYNPRGNGPEGQFIYRPGEPCESDTDCDYPAKCLTEESLCEMPFIPYRNRKLVV